MKKKLLTLMALFAAVTNLCAQNWNMVVTRTDGTKDTIATSNVADVSFYMADQNADQLVIKEVYNGGCPPNEGTTVFQADKGFIIYNNSSQQAVVNNLCVGMVAPYNAEASNGWYDTNGGLVYKSEGYIPAIDGIWYFTEPLIVEAYSQVVVNVCGAIDNTQTVSQSVNYANADYYCMYDTESGYANTRFYPTPSAVIPTSHYLKAVRIGQSNAWPLSATSPALFIFQPQGVTPAEFANNADNITYTPGKAQTAPNRVLKVPAEWVIDGMEVYQSTKLADSKKRFTADIDAGYVTLTSKLGHTLYRNVDKEATEALSENSGKLVYTYSLGVGTSTDPSGIDAEASIKNGAHIIYMDTNNSSNDFHERQKFSLRGE